MILFLATMAHAAEMFNGHAYYFGDLHAHTGVSGDGCAQEYANCGSDADCGSMSAVFDAARANGLDYVALTDHNNNVTSAADFNALLARCRTETSPSFVCIPATEISALRSGSTTRFGHKDLYVFQDDDSRLSALDLSDFPTPTIATGACATDIWSVPSAVAAQFGPTLMWAHHPTATAVATTDWSCHSDAFEPVVEVYSGWGNALTLAPSFDPPSTTDAQAGDATVASATVHAALQDFGLHLGFVAGTDLHDTRPGMTCDRENPNGPHAYGGGLTMVVLDDAAPFKRSAIYGELVARRTLATTGPRIPVEVTWTAGGAEHRIGETVEVADGSDATVTARVPTAYEATVTSVSAIGNATTFGLSEASPGTWTATISGAAIPSWLYVAVEIDGAAFYGPSGCDDGGADHREFVWSSPEWFSVVAPSPASDIDGDGYAATGSPADCNDSLASVHPGAAETCNATDDDCDGAVDEEAVDMVAYFADADGDGFGAGSAFLSCAPVAGMVSAGTDCNDQRQRVYPGAREIVGNSRDEDCDGRAD